MNFLSQDWVGQLSSGLGNTSFEYGSLTYSNIIPFICIQSPSVTCPRWPLFSPWGDRYPPTGPQGRFGELVLMVFVGSLVCRRRLLVKLNYWEIFSKTWWWSLDFVFSLTSPNHTSPPMQDTLKVLPHRLGASIILTFTHLEWPQSSPQPNI